MARKQNKSPIKKTNNQSSIDTKKGGKVAKQLKTGNVQNKNVDHKAKCVKCSKYISKINKIQGNMCSLCLKKEVNVKNKSINVTVSVTPKRKSTRSKENVKKSNAKSNTTNSPSTSKQQNSTKVAKSQLSSPKNVKNSIRGKKNEAVKTEPPALKQSDKNMSLRGKKRSYGQLASGVLNNEISAKKTRTTNKVDNLRTIRNKKPTVKGSEWINTINLKKISVPQKGSIKSKSSPKNKNSPSKKATKSISPKISEATNTKAKTRGSPKERVKEYTKSIPKNQGNKNVKIAPKKPLKPSPLKVNTRLPKIKNSSSKLTQKTTINKSVEIAEKQQRSKLRLMKKNNEEIPLNDNLSKSIRKKFNTCFTNKNKEEDSGMQENVQIVSEILHDILNSVGNTVNDTSLKCESKINNDVVFLECANAEKEQLDNEKECLSKLEDVEMKENVLTKEFCQKSITSYPIPDISYSQQLEDETKFKKIDTNESGGGIRDSSICSSNNDDRSDCVSDIDIHVQNTDKNEINGIHIDDVRQTSFEGLSNICDEKDYITTHKNVIKDMKLGTDTSNNEPHNSVVSPCNVENLKQDNSYSLQGKEYDTETRLNTSVNGSIENSKFQSEDLKSISPEVTSIVETIRPVNENSSNKSIINNKDDDTVPMEVNVDPTMPEVADENNCKSVNVLETVSSEQYSDEYKQKLLDNCKLPNILENNDASLNKEHLNNKGNDGSSTQRGCDNNMQREHEKTILTTKDMIAMESDVLIANEYDDVHKKIDADSESLGCHNSTQGYCDEENTLREDNTTRKSYNCNPHSEHSDDSSFRKYDDRFIKHTEQMDITDTKPNQCIEPNASYECKNKELDSTKPKENNEENTQLECDKLSTIEENSKIQIGQKEDIFMAGCDITNKDGNTHIGKNEDSTFIEKIEIDNPNTKQNDDITEQNEDDKFKEHIDIDIPSTNSNEDNTFKEHIDIDNPSIKQNNYIREQSKDNKEHIEIPSKKPNEDNAFKEHIDIVEPRTKQDNDITLEEFDKSQNEEYGNNSGIEHIVYEATLKCDQSTYNEHSEPVWNEKSNEDNKLQSSDHSIFKGKEDNVPDNNTNGENLIDVLKVSNSSSNEDHVSNNLERECNGSAEWNDKIKELDDNSIPKGCEDTMQKGEDSCLRQVGDCESSLSEHDNVCNKDDNITDVTSMDNIVSDSEAITTQKNSTDHLEPEKMSNSNISVECSNNTSIQLTSRGIEARVIEENDGNTSINIETDTDGNATVFDSEDVNGKTINVDGKIEVKCNSIDSQKENGKIECMSSIEESVVNSSISYDNNHSSVNINDTTSGSKDEKYYETDQKTDFTLFDNEKYSSKSNNETIRTDDKNKSDLGNSNITEQNISNLNSCTTSTENLNNEEEISGSVDTNTNKNDLNQTVEKKENANLSNNELSLGNTECLITSPVRIDNIKNTESLEDSTLQEECLNTNEDINSYNESTNVVDETKIMLEDDTQISVKNKKIDCEVTSLEGKTRELAQSIGQPSSHVTSLLTDSDTPGLDSNSSICNKEKNELPIQLDSTEDKNFTINQCDESGISINLESSSINKEENDGPTATQPTSELSNIFPKDNQLPLNIKHKDEESDNYMEVDVGDETRVDDTQFKSHTEENITSTMSHVSVDKVKVQPTFHDTVNISSSIETTEEGDNAVIKTDSINGNSCDNSDTNNSKSDENDVKMEVS